MQGGNKAVECDLSTNKGAEVLNSIMFCAGAHTLGRVKKDRSGFGKEKTKYTENGPGTPGGTSWTIEWLKFDNSYFKVLCTGKTRLALRMLRSS